MTPLTNNNRPPLDKVRIAHAVGDAWSEATDMQWQLRKQARGAAAFVREGQRYEFGVSNVIGDPTIMSTAR